MFIQPIKRQYRIEHIQHVAAVLERFVDGKNEARQLVFDPAAFLTDSNTDAFHFTAVQEYRHKQNDRTEQREDEQHGDGENADNRRLNSWVGFEHLRRYIHLRGL